MNAALGPLVNYENPPGSLQAPLLIVTCVMARPGVNFHPVKYSTANAALFPVFSDYESNKASLGKVGRYIKVQK
jgi:hypothetical protein